MPRGVVTQGNVGNVFECKEYFKWISYMIIWAYTVDIHLFFDFYTMIMCIIEFILLLINRICYILFNLTKTLSNHFRTHRPYSILMMTIYDRIV